MATMGLKMMAGTCLLFLLVGVAFAEPGDFPAEFEFMGYTTNIDTPKYRLKDTVQPRNIKVDLDVYLSESRFTGTVELEVETSENLTQIVMHQNVVAISAITVLDDGNQPVILQSPGSFDTDSYYEILIINFASTIPPSNYTITISYTGQINENPTDRGFYKGYYHDGNTVREYATTQFQPYHARKAFPCFDEPQFKCPFTIAITRDASLGPTYSNMAIERTDEMTPNRIRETFLPTPVISAYLIAFHVSDFIATNSSAVDGKPLQIISRPGVTSQHPYAADMAMKITNGMDEYFDIDYYNMGQGQPMKNDHIALPDFPSGAMENWGMVNYREAYLLYDEEHTNVIDKIFIATILAHELAHKWFGNLVTCFWWSNLWLNESFASYFEHFGAHMADKDLELDNRFITSHVQRALGADASPSINAMNWSAVADNPSISAHFGTSSYVKGASVLRTMEHLLGYTTFRNGLRHYLKDNEYGIGYPVDMYNALRKAASEDASFQATYPGADIGEVLDSWVQTPGSPVVNVYVNMTSGLISLTQERFQLTGTPPDDLWHIPITWTHGGNVNFDNLKPTMIMSGKTGTLQSIPGHHWVILNLQHSGLYRVNYDDHNWEMLANQLRKDKNVIHRLNRAQITNDVLFFLRAGKIKAERAFDVLSFLKDESDYYVWFGPLAQLDWIRSRLEHLPKAHEEFSAYILDMFTGAIKELTYDEKENENIAVTQSRMQILNYACNLGHQGCISDSLNKWNAFRSDPKKLVPKNARRYVYCTGLRQGDASDYNFLFERYNTSQNTADMVVMLRTLACTKDEASLRHYLFQSMHSDKIRIHDRTNAFSFALQGNRENLEIVLDFLYKNFEEIRETYGGEARLSTAISALSSYLTDYRDIVQFQSWLYTNQVALGDSFSTGKGVISTAMNNLGWGNEAAKDVILATRGSSAVITASISLLLLALSAHILK